MAPAAAPQAIRIIGVVFALAALQLDPRPAAAQSSDLASKQNVRIPAGDVELAATLYRPAGARGSLPAVVTAHGSAASDRKMMLYFTEVALDMGLAVLTFDKRGVGESTGKYEPFKVADSPRVFKELANDVAHSVRWLTGQPGIDPKRIGLFGGSQAGWIMPLAASQEPRVSFILTVSGVSLTAGQEDIHGTYLEAVQKNKQRNTWSHVYAANQLALEYTGEQGYDPATVLQAITTPTLWVWGLYDTALPTIPSIDRVGELIKSGKTNNYVHVLPYGGHNPRNVFTGEQYDLVPVLRPWLEQRGVLPKTHQAVPPTQGRSKSPSRRSTRRR
jgi:dipeptidyl aminopeptidase/acylaminoacyl peptidase